MNFPESLFHRVSGKAFIQFIPCRPQRWKCNRKCGEVVTQCCNILQCTLIFIAETYLCFYFVSLLRKEVLGIQYIYLMCMKTFDLKYTKQIFISSRFRKCGEAIMFGSISIIFMHWRNTWQLFVWITSLSGKDKISMW